MSRRQVRRMVRLEAVAIALLGTLLGSVLGLGSTWALVRSLRDEGFAAPVLPVPTLVAVALGAVLAGVLAAALPARRAAGLPVLDAVADRR
jgi:putative ABC transport system permease protein